MSKYGRYVVKFRDGSYMTKSRSKTTDRNKAHKYILSDDAYSYNWFRFEEMSIVCLNDDGTDTIIYSFEKCKKLKENVERLKGMLSNGGII
jgi:hypothetical protein